MIKPWTLHTWEKLLDWPECPNTLLLRNSGFKTVSVRVQHTKILVSMLGIALVVYDKYLVFRSLEPLYLGRWILRVLFWTY